jgi:uncharacterized protein (DUF1501 family)
MKEPNVMTRRRFLRNGVIGSALAATVPTFLDQTLLRLDAAEAASGLQRPSGKDGPILVLLQLAGGNDGLNSVIPLENDHYRRARPRLKQVEAGALRLNDHAGFHENMAGLKSLYDEGLLSVIQGVGYPNPNRSHFRSTEIWHTGDPASEEGSDGWIGRFFDNQCRGMPPETGISLTGTPPQAFQGRNGMGITFRNPREFTFDDDIELMAGGSVGPASGRVKEQLDSPLSFLERTHLDAHLSSETLHQTLKRIPKPAGFPRGRLAADLELVSRLIAGGMPTRIYYLSQGGYDTHANQAGAHARLMLELSEAQKAFWGEMKRQGNAARVRMLVFSEFGRRVTENGSGGTDHGAAAPVFVLGQGLQGGIHGSLPSLSPSDLNRGDLVHHTDFRQIYATLLDQHLKADATRVLGRKWDAIQI